MTKKLGGQNRPGNLTNGETRKLVEPAIITTLLISSFLFLNGLSETDSKSLPVGLISFLLALGLQVIILPSATKYKKNSTLIVLLYGLPLGFYLSLGQTAENHISVAIVLLFAAIFAVLWERKAALIFIFTSVSPVILVGLLADPINILHIAAVVFFMLVSSVITEIISRLIKAMRARIERLEIINEFARKIGASLEAEQVVNIVNAALQKAIDADSYYLGILEGDHLALNLFYDEGEYFSNLKLPIDGTLSGWVIEHQKPLFMPDLRHEADLEGVKLVIVGQERTSLSWMGVPMITAHMKGILAVASYRPNAFNRTDMELLENLGQQAALALDNAYHHDKVEKQARLDSLTQIYNHGYFLELLKTEAGRAEITGSSMCLIMLDIDHFKQYNDNYGHLAGDQVLIEITKIITCHIHPTDSVGRWGGEEFGVLFPNTTGLQVHNIARRIQEKVNKMKLTSTDGRLLPLPTVSQGIAVYPDEMDDIIKLVDLADQRLYIAKERGRNQIEPNPQHWAKIGRR